MSSALSCYLPQYWQISSFNNLNDHNALLDLFHNKIPALSFKNFATPEECHAMASVLDEIGFENYLNVQPPISRIGVTQYEAKKMGKSWYFDKVMQENKKQIYAFKKSFDPIKRLTQVIQNILPHYRVYTANEMKTAYYAGLVRQINNTALIHADYAPYDAPNWTIAKIVAQLAWNVCIKAPVSGGECVVYNKPWYIHQDESFMIPNSYGYQMEVIKDCERKIIQPTVGEAYFFNSRNFHEVRSSEGERITISCFVGLLKEKQIVLWS